MQDCIKDYLVDVPPHITDVLRHRGYSVQTLSPDFVASCLTSTASYKSFSFEDKMNIFQYLVSDGNYSRLNWLELLPVNNNTFVVFGNRNQCSRVLVCKDEIALFPGQEDKFVRQNLPDEIYDSLVKMAKQGILFVF